MRAVQVAEGVIVGDDCVVEEEAILGDGVAVYPSKVIEAGTVQNQSVIWESRGQRALFGPRGVSGLVNVEITPELCVRLATAYATTLRKGSLVTVARDASRAARAFKRAVISALTASAIEVRDLEVSTMPIIRWDVRVSESVGGIMMRTSPGDPQSIDLVFIDEQGADISRGARRASSSASTPGRSSAGRSRARSPSCISPPARWTPTCRTCASASTPGGCARPG